MNLLLILPGFIYAFIIVLYYERKVRNMSAKTNKNVHFYVARDKYHNILCLYLGKPIKGIDRFHACHNGCIVTCAEYLSDFGLDSKDFENLKFEDEPIEVFLNLEN